MEQVRVYNDNTFEHREQFKGQNIVIAPGKFVEMDRGEAVLFKGQFFQPRFLADGVQDPRSFKRIRLEAIVEEKGKGKGKKAKKSDAPEHVCQACGFEAVSAAGLKVHIAKNHVGDMLDEDAREELSS